MLSISPNLKSSYFSFHKPFFTILLFCIVLENHVSASASGFTDEEYQTLMEKTNHHEILEIDTTASAQDIKKAYRKLARKYHADRNPGSQENAERAFKKINQAYIQCSKAIESLKEEVSFFEELDNYIGNSFFAHCPTMISSQRSDLLKAKEEEFVKLFLDDKYVDDAGKSLLDYYYEDSKVYCACTQFKFFCKQYKLLCMKDFLLASANVVDVSGETLVYRILTKIHDKSYGDKEFYTLYNLLLSTEGIDINTHPVGQPVPIKLWLDKSRFTLDDLYGKAKKETFLPSGLLEPDHRLTPNSINQFVITYFKNNGLDDYGKECLKSSKLWLNLKLGAFLVMMNAFILFLVDVGLNKSALFKYIKKKLQGDKKGKLAKSKDQKVNEQKDEKRDPKSKQPSVALTFIIFSIFALYEAYLFYFQPDL